MARDTIDRRTVLKAASALGATGLGVPVAGCIDGDQAAPTDTDEPMDTPTETDAGDGMDAGATVAVDSHDVLGEVLVDGEGTTLYMFEPDDQGESTCYDDCANAWPPLTVEDADAVEADSGVSAELGTTERDDGSLQVTAGGWPLYYFAGDEQPGDATGQEFGGVWYVLRPDGTVVRPTVGVSQHDELGEILVDGEGMTLYMFEPDDQGESTCYDDCANAWPPLTVEGADDLVESVVATADVATTERDDGSLQVTAGGWPLYYFAQDEQPGDAAGQGVGDVWYVLRSDGTVVRGDAMSTATPTPSPTPTSTSGDDGDGYGY